MVARCTGVLHAIIIRDGDQANMALRLDSDALAQAAPRLSERIVGARRWAAGLYIRAVLIATGVFAVD